MFAKTFVHIAASVLLHGSIVGVVLAFSSGEPAPEEQVYRVTLAEFSAPAPPVAAPAPQPPHPEPPHPEPPKPEPVIEPPKPEPVAKKPPKPKATIISAKKTAEKKKPAEETQPAAPPPPPAPVQTASAAPVGSAGPTMNIGGLAAYNVDVVDQKPSIARRVVPEYPQKARRMNVQGKVFVRLVVDTAGRPKECKIHQADPAGYFEDAALIAARKTRFIPGKVKGQPVNTVVLVPFVFALR